MGVVEHHAGRPHPFGIDAADGHGVAVGQRDRAFQSEVHQGSQAGGIDTDRRVGVVVARLQDLAVTNAPPGGGVGVVDVEAIQVHPGDRAIAINQISHGGALPRDRLRGEVLQFDGLLRQLRLEDVDLLPATGVQPLVGHVQESWRHLLGLKIVDDGIATVVEVHPVHGDGVGGFSMGWRHRGERQSQGEGSTHRKRSTCPRQVHRSRFH